MSKTDDETAGQQLAPTTTRTSIDVRLAQLRAQGTAKGMRVCPNCQQQFHPDPALGPDRQPICLECALDYLDELTPILKVLMSGDPMADFIDLAAASGFSVEELETLRPVMLLAAAKQ